ncbi:nucleoside/nucleotide kinase family protein [Buttiauxella selenatireducens]|uniref:Nucleoside/nucleotide kinase family protein n=1 Tax=Buttiauxella selenatireducens TaxID=3073902 RepID=A0ABY9SC37_9ENTR|nr:nucleoside/nucleotide kinase family protein [Buttiauxella sp. R73]WMY75078.1 nucleoside/nucleotide kinase family protein [Buttiauxella sp. R73]
MNVTLMINGLETQARFNDEEVEKLHKPLLKLLVDKQKQLQRRLVVFLAAPPGTGKSTLAAFWEYLAAKEPELPAIQALPMDGFHHYNDYLLANNLKQHKGAPQTFNVQKLTDALCALHQPESDWPQYDRNLHDPVENAIAVEAPIVVVEGNWLLLNRPEWQSLRVLCDYSVFISAPPELLSERLIGRKMRGGLTRQQAEEFFHTTDGLNVLRVLENSQPADMQLRMDEQGGYHQD